MGTTEYTENMEKFSVYDPQKILTVPRHMTQSESLCKSRRYSVF